MSARLWVTGVGLVTPLGVGVETTWRRLVRGERAIRSIRLFPTDGQRASVAGEVDGLGIDDDTFAGARVGSGQARGRSVEWSRTSVMAWAAADEAMRAAAVDVRRARVGLVVGGTTGGMFENEQGLARLHAEPECRETFPQMLSHPLTSTADCLDARLGPFSRVRTLASACSSGANALIVAASWLLSGEIDIAVAGGSDGLCRLTLTGFNALGALDPEPCRPFDLRRRGTNLGEGAAFLVLERADRARLRNGAQRPIAELAGWALGAEAHHITNPAPEGARVAELIERAIGRADLRPSDVDYVSAHGTGTSLNDAMEATALHSALGVEIQRVAVSSSKGQLGHTLGASGAIEAAITCLVIARRTLVPTAGLDEPDPALGLVHVPRVGREVPRVRVALSNAFGFGGMDTILVLTEPDLKPRAPFRSSAPRNADSPAPVITGMAVYGACGLFASEQCAQLLDQQRPSDKPPDPDVHLDIARARRLDRTARLATVAVQHALADARASPQGTGVVLGSAYGNVDGSAAFMHRVFERGPRVASPAEFPNLVPSSPVGHVSIYLGLRGPVFTTADLGTSGESAFAQAAQFVSAGEAARIVAGAVEPKSAIVDRVLSSLFGDTPQEAHAIRSDLAAAIVIEAELEARARGVRVLARIRQIVEWRTSDREVLASLEAPRGDRAEVVLARAGARADALVGRTPWKACVRIPCAPVFGESDALGAVAIAVAVGHIATERVNEALVVGLARRRGFAIVLSR